MNFAIAFNSRTSLYEVHVPGCAHLISSHLETMTESWPGENGKAAAASYEAKNDGLLTKLGPCAKGGAK